MRELARNSHKSCGLLPEYWHCCISAALCISMIHKNLFVTGIWVPAGHEFFIKFKCLVNKRCGTLQYRHQMWQAKMCYFVHVGVYQYFERPEWWNNVNHWSLYINVHVHSLGTFASTSHGTTSSLFCIYFLTNYSQILICEIEPYSPKIFSQKNIAFTIMKDIENPTQRPRRYLLLLLVLTGSSGRFSFLNQLCRRSLWDLHTTQLSCKCLQ